MKNNLLLFTLTLLLLGLSACQKDITDPAQTSNAGATDRDPVTPFKATYETYPEIVSVIGGIITLSIPGEGKATHLGKSTWYADSWVDTNQFPWLQTGDMEFTAANGDKLYGSFSGIAVPDASGKVEFEGTYEITGGSGRFEGATGSGNYSGWALGNLGHLEFDGTLSNP